MNVPLDEICFLKIGFVEKEVAPVHSVINNTEVVIEDGTTNDDQLW